MPGSPVGVASMVVNRPSHEHHRVLECPVNYFQHVRIVFLGIRCEYVGDEDSYRVIKPKGMIHNRSIREGGEKCAEGVEFFSRMNGEEGRGTTRAFESGSAAIRQIFARLVVATRCRKVLLTSVEHLTT